MELECGERERIKGEEGGGGLSLSIVGSGCFVGHGSLDSVACMESSWLRHSAPPATSSLSLATGFLVLLKKCFGTRINDEAAARCKKEEEDAQGRRRRGSSENANWSVGHPPISSHKQQRTVKMALSGKGQLLSPA